MHHSTLHRSEIRGRGIFGSRPEILRVEQLIWNESILLNNLDRTFKKSFASAFLVFFTFYPKKKINKLRGLEKNSKYKKILCDITFVIIFLI